MFHQYGHHDIDEHKLSHEDEGHEEHWRYESADAAVASAGVARITIIPQGVLERKS